MATLEEMAWATIARVKSDNDAQFAKYVLQARSQYLGLRLRQDRNIRQVYIDAADRVADELRRLPTVAGRRSLTQAHMATLDKNLHRVAEEVNRGVDGFLREGLLAAAGLGSEPLRRQMESAVGGVGLSVPKLQRGFAEVNTRAVEAIWARTNNDGLRLSDRIWKTADGTREAMREIIVDAVARGRDAVKVARDLETYVREGSQSLAKDYPNMLERMGKRIPKDLSYPALRVARTEMSIALQEGTYAAGRVTPSYKGVRWCLSSSHPLPDVCNDLAAADLYKLGAGIYPQGQEPVVPHPNCLCYSAPIVQDTKEFVQRLKDWRSGEADVELDRWHDEFFSQAAGLEAPVIQSRPTPQPVGTLYRPGRTMAISDIETLQFPELVGFQDPILAGICKAQGYDGLPQLVDTQAFDGLVGEGHEVLYRGVTSAEYAEQFRTGDLFYGRGIYGNGTYTAYGGVGEKTAGEYSRGTPGGMMRMALVKDAKIADFDQVYKEMYTATIERPINMESVAVGGDPGRYAALLGYDALRVGGSEYMIVLNRTALVVEK